MWQCGNCGNVNSGPKCAKCGAVVPPTPSGDGKGTPLDLWRAIAIAGIIIAAFSCIGFLNGQETSTMIRELGKRGYRVYGPFPEDRDPNY